MKRSLLIILILSFSLLFAGTVSDSLLVHGRVMLDGEGMPNVLIAGLRTDSTGYYAFKVPSGTDTTLVPKRFSFLFTPSEYHITPQDSLLDSLNFIASRQIKKTIIISGQSNAEHVGEPKFFIEDTVDNHIPYYLAYSGGEFGISTLGLLTKFGYSKSYCDGYNRGFGLEILLARTLYKKYTDSLAVIKAPYSGTSLYADWKADGPTWSWFVEKHDNAVELYRERGYEPQYIGFFWFQGESDELGEAASGYAARLREFVDRIRVRFPNGSDSPNLPFVCVRINWNHDSPFEPTIRAAQVDLPNQREDCAWVDVDDCDPFRYSSKNMHFSGGALNRIGYKMANSYLELIGVPVDSSTSITVDLDETVDTTVILTVEGDTSFTHEMTDLSYTFPAKLGDYFELSLNLNSETYNYSPAMRTVIFAYDNTALVDTTYSFNVNKVVAIADYPDEMEHLLMDCYPNPFNPATSIDFRLPSDSDVEMCIFNLLGRKIATLVDMPMEQGAYEARWNASDIPSGIYVVRLRAGGETVFQKLTLLK